MHEDRCKHEVLLQNSLLQHICHRHLLTFCWNAALN